MAHQTHLEPSTPQWDAAWAELARRVGSLDGWQYMGPAERPNANAAHAGEHVFRLRAGVGANTSDRNRIEYVALALRTAPPDRWAVGDRVQLAPHLDLWMRGARYGTVRRVSDGVATVALDFRGMARIALTDLMVVP